MAAYEWNDPAVGLADYIAAHGGGGSAGGMTYTGSYDGTKAYKAGSVVNLGNLFDLVTADSSPNGTVYQIVVANDGTLSTTAA